MLPDLGSHLLDTCRFWFGDISDEFSVVSANAFENRAPDHVVIVNESRKPRIELEMTLADVAQPLHLRHPRRERHRAHPIAVQVGSDHLHPAHARAAERTPPEDNETLAQEDPTWAAEYAHFKTLCQSGARTDLSTDIWLHRTLERLSHEVVMRAAVKP